MSRGFQKTTFQKLGVTAKGVETTRRTPRRVYSRPVGLLRHGEFCLVQALQLSEGGLLFHSPLQFAVGEAIVLSIIVPGGSSVVVRAEIIYVKPAQPASLGQLQYGVKFAPLTLPLRRLIRIYVTAKTQAEAEAEQFAEQFNN